MNKSKITAILYILGFLNFIIFFILSIILGFSLYFFNELYFFKIWFFIFLGVPLSYCSGSAIYCALKEVKLPMGWHSEGGAKEWGLGAIFWLIGLLAIYLWLSFTYKIEIVDIFSFLISIVLFIIGILVYPKYTYISSSNK